MKKLIQSQLERSNSKLKNNTNKIRIFDSRAETVMLWKLPNVSGVSISKVQPGFTEKFFAALGISYTRRNIKFSSGNNGERVRFLQHMHLELLKLTGTAMGTPDKSGASKVYKKKNLLLATGEKTEVNESFWFLALTLLQRSTSFFYKNLLDNDVRYFRNKPIQELLTVRTKYFKILRRVNPYPDLRRTWIQSPPGKARALTVPSFVWRVATSGYSRILETYLYGSHPPFQHAYMINKGTGTVWRQLLNTAINESNIWEFDLKQFFPSVSHRSLVETLKQIGRLRSPLISSLYYCTSSKLLLVLTILLKSLILFITPPLYSLRPFSTNCVILPNRISTSQKLSIKACRWVWHSPLFWLPLFYKSWYKRLCWNTPKHDSIFMPMTGWFHVRSL